MKGRDSRIDVRGGDFLEELDALEVLEGLERLERLERLEARRRAMAKLGRKPNNIALYARVCAHYFFTLWGYFYPYTNRG